MKFEKAECPPLSLLTEFSEGQVGDNGVFEAIADHLEGCKACETRLENSLRHDTLVNSLRNAARNQGFVGNDELLHKAMWRALSVFTPNAEKKRDTDEETNISSGLTDAGSSGGADNFVGSSQTPTTLGPYQLIEELGRGGMGVVFRGLHTMMNRPVAVKILAIHRNSETAARRFEKEIRAVGQLTHPNIVTGYDAGVFEGRCFLAMELLKGVDLSTLAKSLGNQIHYADVCEMIRQAALGLSHAHKAGIIHRDIKPANMMLCEASPVHQSELEPIPLNESAEAVVKILDMGLARMELATAQGLDMTGTGQMFGTVHYMPPEQCLDARDVDVRSDVYSLGGSLFRLLVGHAPWAGGELKTRGQILNAIMSKQHPSVATLLPGLPEPLTAIVDRALRKDSAGRFQSMEEMIAALKPLAAGHELPKLLERTRAVVNKSQTPDATVDFAQRPNGDLMSEQAHVPDAIRGPRPASAESKEQKTKSITTQKKNLGSQAPPWWTNRMLQLVGLGGLALLLGIVFFVRIGKYDVQITLDDPTVTLSVDGQVLNVKDGEDVYQLSAGEHKLQLQKDGLKTHVEEFVVTKNGETAIEVAIVDGKLDALLNGEQPSLSTRARPPNPTERNSNDLDGSSLASNRESSVSIEELLTSSDYEWTEPVRLPFPDGQRPHNVNSIVGYASWQNVYLNAWNDATKSFDFFVAQRSLDGKRLGIPKVLPELLKGSSFEGGCSIADDGLLMVFDSSRNGGLGRRDVWIVERKSIQDSFGPPVNAGESVNNGRDGREPALSGDGLTLVWVAPFTPEGEKAKYGLRIANRKNRKDPFENAQWLSIGGEVKTEGGSPWLSPDGSTLLFCRRAAAGFEFRVTTRNSATGSFGPAICFAEALPGFSRRLAPSLSPDRKWLYFSSNQGNQDGAMDLWMCQRVKKDSSRESLPSKSLKLKPTVSEGVVNLGTGTAKSVDSGVSISALLTSSDYEWTEPILVPFPEGHQPTTAFSLTGFGTWQSVYFCAWNHGMGSGDIFVADRSADGGAWGIPKALPEPINGAARESGVSVTKDGLLMVFCSDLPNGQGLRDLWIAERKSTNEPFGEPINAGEFVNSAVDDADPTLSGDGLTLVWRTLAETEHNRQELQLRIASRKSRKELFENSKLLRLNGEGNWGQVTPWLSPDGNTLIFVKKNPAPHQFFVSKRKSSTDEFGPAIRFGEELGFNDGLSPCLSPDGEWFYFSSRRDGGTLKLWMCQRVKKDLVDP